MNTEERKARIAEIEAFLAEAGSTQRVLDLTLPLEELEQGLSEGNIEFVRDIKANARAEIAIISRSC
jgi:hypothetical protein